MTTDIPTIRHDGWTVERQMAFHDALSHGISVAEAAADVGLSASSAYRKRGREPRGAFAAGWQAAQAMAYQRLRDLALDRAINGVGVATMWRGQVVGTRRVFSDRLLLGLLAHLRPAEAEGARPAEDPQADFAAVVDAYAEAVEQAREPDRPRLTGEPEPAPPPPADADADADADDAKPLTELTRAEIEALIAESYDFGVADGRAYASRDDGQTAGGGGSGAWAAAGDDRDGAWAARAVGDCDRDGAW
ncbi:MAG: hypothetical protein JO290_00715, partial [Sphingomonadaceae bacterium]|nr:hypothetical protein [Sphingomonadaceae bacterium]